MPEAAPRKTERVLVTCDTSPLGTAALDAAASLARHLDAELAGLFVEDINLLRMATLPFAREYALASAAVRPVASGELERTLRQQADALRGALSRAAQTLSVPWSFQVVRGALLDSVLEAMRAPDLVVFGHTGQFAVVPGIRQAPAQSRPHSAEAVPRQPILTIYDGSPAADRALTAAQTLAQVHRTNVVVLVQAEEAATVASLRARAMAQFAGSRVGVHFHRLPARDCSAIKNIVETHHAAALLWHGVETADDKRSLAILVDALKCPVVLVT
jgi:nucleotide-binding universal stress UspA family protein